MRWSMRQVVDTAGELEQAGCGLCSPRLERWRDRSRPEDARGVGGAAGVRAESLGGSERDGRLRAGRAAPTTDHAVVLCVDGGVARG
jgi:hypothetical protein